MRAVRQYALRRPWACPMSSGIAVPTWTPNQLAAKVTYLLGAADAEHLATPSGCERDLGPFTVKPGHVTISSWAQTPSWWSSQRS